MLKKSLVVFTNRDVIAHVTHNKAIDEYAKKNGITREEAYSKGHVLSILNMIEHDIADVIVHFGDKHICIEILEDVGISVTGGE